MEKTYGNFGSRDKLGRFTSHIVCKASQYGHVRTPYVVTTGRYGALSSD